MPYRKTQFVNDGIYHIVMRRIGDKSLFLGKDDYYRGIFSLYEFNNAKAVEISKRRRDRIIEKKRLAKIGGDRVSAKLKLSIDGREKLIDILAFTLMPNHMHILVRQLKEGGITKFVNKVGAGYPAYFRKKHKIKEKGYFFQSRFVSVPIKTDEQLITTFVYIHTNPVSLIESGWKEGKVKNKIKAIKFLEDYRWSSYQDYLGKKNFSSVTERDFLTEMIGGEKNIKALIKEWISHKKDIKIMEETVLE
ncbi:MAG: transposase [bacterium]|nr:transposase [bacterium]